MKAYFQLAQAQIALHHTAAALSSARQAHAFCVEEVVSGGKGGSSIGPITELVLKCKKEDWERREREREGEREGLLGDVVRGLEKSKSEEIELILHDDDEGREGKLKEVEEKWDSKIEDVRRVFERAGLEGAEKARRRKVPDWCVDDITFSVMLDPVVVSSPSHLLLHFTSLFIPLPLPFHS